MRASICSIASRQHGIVPTDLGVHRATAGSTSSAPIRTDKRPLRTRTATARRSPIHSLLPPTAVFLRQILRLRLLSLHKVISSSADARAPAAIPRLHHRTRGAEGLARALNHTTNLYYR